MQKTLQIPDEQPSKKTKNLKPLQGLWPFARLHRGRIILALIALVIASSATLALPLAVRRMIDHGFDQNNHDVINSYFAGLMILVLVLSLASSLRYYLVMTLGAAIAADVREAVFKHLTKLDVTFFDTVKSGEVVSRLTSDTEQIRSVFGPTASVALRNGVLFCGAVLMMIITNAWLSLLVLGAIPLIVLPLVFWGRAVKHRAEEAQERLAHTSAFATEAVSSTRIMKSYVMERDTANTYQQASRAAYEASRQSLASRAVLTAGVIFSISASIVAVLWYGAGQVISQKLSGGMLSQFILYAVFAASALGQLSEVYGEIQQAAGSAMRLSSWLGLNPTIAVPSHPVILPLPTRGEITFKDVHFHYPSGRDMPALNGVSFAIKQSEHVALVGASGAGKSTILQILNRFYDPDSGQILFDGVDLKALDPENLRKNIAYVTQEPVIFGMSVRDNIRYGTLEANDAQIKDAASLAAADAFIQELPQGYDTMLGERGVNLSGGQRQRIALARAILKRAPVLVLDEATSALDAESEAAVQRALDHLAHKQTMIVVAHRLATVLKADRILVFEEGRIVEEGTHAQLMKNNGIYARFAQLQFL